MIFGTFFGKSFCSCGRRKFFSKQNFILFNIFFIYRLLVLSGLAGAVALGTFLDYLTETKFGQNWSTELNLLPVKLIRCFSLVKNTKMLYDVRGRGETKNATGDKKKQTNGASKSRSKENNNLNSLSNTVVCTSAEKRRRAVSLDILDGIRVFTILWIIAAHCSSMTQIPVLMKISPLAHFPWTFFENRDANWLVSSYLLSTYYPVSIFFMVRYVKICYLFLYILTYFLF